ncbi:Na+/H+ antiporter subunit E [Chloroflexota bacterium]
MILSRLLVSAALAVLWCLLQNSFTPQNLVVGFILGIAIVLALGNTAGMDIPSARVFSIRRLLHILNYIAHLFKEISLASLRVARLVLMPRLRIRPGIVALPVEVKGDLEVMLLGNSITLTPGTWTLAVSEDHGVLYIHTLDIEQPEQTKTEIRNGLEKYILRMGR